MTSTMLLSLAAFTAVAWIGVLVFARATGLIGGAIAQRSRKPLVIAETADEQIEFAPRPNYPGLRASIMRADDAARFQ